MFFGPIGKTRWPPDIFHFSSETVEWNSTKLERKQDLNILYHVCVFRSDQKNKMAPRPLISWDFFDFSSETAERISTKLDNKLYLSVSLRSLCFSGRSEKQDDLPGIWLAETFRHLLWNHWTKFHEIWQEIRSQHPLQSMCFSSPSEKQNDLPGLWLAETFSTSPLKSLNGIQRNLTRSKISVFSTKCVFFGPIGKTIWLPRPLIGWDIFDFSAETAELNSTKLDEKQDHNLLY